MNLERHIFPSLGAKALPAIGRSDCKAVIAACRERARHEGRKNNRGAHEEKQQPKLDVSVTARKLKARTIEGVCRTLSVVLSSAVDDGYLQANPAFRLGRYIQRKRHDPEAEIQALTAEETAKLLDTVKEHFSREYPLLLAALRTGMRMGELLGLRWGDIDFDQRLIHVRRNLTAGEVTRRTAKLVGWTCLRNSLKSSVHC